jgi:hypothetical protein
MKISCQLHTPAALARRKNLQCSLFKWQAGSQNVHKLPYGYRLCAAVPSRLESDLSAVAYGVVGRISTVRSQFLRQMMTLELYSFLFLYYKIHCTVKITLG